MKNHLLVFLSEILSAKTLVPIVSALKRDSSIEIQIVNDGFCKEFVESLEIPFTCIESDFESRIRPIIAGSALILMGKTYIQPSEYQILNIAQQEGTPVLLSIPDMGFDIVHAKLIGIGGGYGEGAPLPLLMLADQRTIESLRRSGIPDSHIIEAGNPYFDELYQELEINPLRSIDAKRVGYFSTPFELDYTRGILPAKYAQAQLIQDIREACSKLGYELVGKRHPQVPESLFDGIPLFEGRPIDLIRDVKVGIGSYSTTLIECWASGLPTVSYQPWKADIRGDVFADRIPIVKTPQELLINLERAMGSELDPHLDTRFVTCNPGTSTETYLKVIRDIIYGIPREGLDRKRGRTKGLDV